ncbi:MAG: amidohydrolase family protein [Chitinophagales bacterium]
MNSVIAFTGNQGEKKQNNSVIEFENALAFPGLINSHDHLDFNLFPKFGNKIYSNYVLWGNEINRQFKEEIQKILNVPQDLRIKWGIYKNLLNGFTTVVNHGVRLPINLSLIDIIQQANNLHSVQFERNWKWKINKDFRKNGPLVIHAGEGTDEGANKEINQLIKWNIFRKRIIAVHGVAMDAKQASKFMALVWCPASNFSMLNQTARVDLLRHNTRILFGTDSTLTADWNAWEHFRAARNTRMVPDDGLFNMLTTEPAMIWDLPLTGKLEGDYFADIVIAKKPKGLDGWDAFYEINPSDILMVIHKGEVRLFDGELSGKIEKLHLPRANFAKLIMGERCKYVYGELPDLIKQIRKYLPGLDLPIHVG